jgi:ectoine hydroxylase-related dioxygenase (phytanoyl-CoA dioxygenase family)
MKSFDSNAFAEARAEFSAKGACCLRGVFDLEWVELVRRGLDEAATRPSHLSKTWTGDQGQGQFFQDGFAWNRFEPLRNFIFESPAASVVARLMGSTRVGLYMDHILVREPNTNKTTPWHHDTPYCFVDGNDFCTIWFPLDPIAMGEGLKLVSGSHKWGKMFLPVEFGSTAAYAHEASERSYELVPDIDASQNKHEILSWQLELGDCVVFYCSMLHSAPAHLATESRRRVYSTRWIGNDARFATRAWSVPPLPTDPGLKPGDLIEGALFPRVL